MNHKLIMSSKEILIHDKSKTLAVFFGNFSTCEIDVFIYYLLKYVHMWCNSLCTRRK